MRVSRTKPSRRDVSVAPPTLAKCLTRLIGRGSRGLHFLERAGLVEADRFKEAAPDAVLPCLRHYLVPGEVGHVERVDHPLAEGGDVRGGDVEAELRYRMREIVEEAVPVEALHFDHGETVGQFVRHRHLRLDREGVAAAARRALAG